VDVASHRHFVQFICNFRGRESPEGGRHFQIFKRYPDELPGATSNCRSSLEPKIDLLPTTCCQASKSTCCQTPK
jgi:hypothetical protein